MNTQDKASHQKTIQAVLTGMGSVISKLVVDRDTHAAQLQNLHMHGAQMYTSEYIELETKNLKNKFALVMATAYKDIDSRLESLRKLIFERDAVLDLANPALSTALALIQAAGGAPTHEQAAEINQNFRYDQQALRAIYTAYGQKDIGGIGKMIYSVDEVIDGLKELAHDATVKDGSVNFFASRLAKFAAIEGVELNPNPDDRGTMEAMRRGAGLK